MPERPLSMFSLDSQHAPEAVNRAFVIGSQSPVSGLIQPLLNRARRQLHSAIDDDVLVNTGDVEKYVQAIQSGDTAGIEKLLNEDIVEVSDGGGKVSDAINPVLGSHDVAAFIAGIFSKFYTHARVEIGEVNHQPDLFFYVNEHLSTCQVLSFEEGRLKNIFFMRNPEKLRLLAVAHI